MKQIESLSLTEKLFMISFSFLNFGDRKITVDDNQKGKVDYLPVIKRSWRGVQIM